MRKKFFVRIIFLLALVGAGSAVWLYQSDGAARAQISLPVDMLQPAEEERGISASGIIEASEAEVVPEVGGTITVLYVDEGDEIEAGQIIAKLDTAIIEAQIAQAEAAVEVAQAQLAQVNAGTPPTKIAQAEAELALVQVRRDVMERVWRDAVILRDNPQELNMQINATRYQLQAAELTVQQMGLMASAVDVVDQMFYRVYEDAKEGFTYEFQHPVTEKKYRFHFEAPSEQLNQLNFEWGSSTSRVWEAWEVLEQAKAARAGVQRSLDNLLSKRDNPVELNAAVNAARVQLDVVEAEIAAAEAALAAVKAGATIQQIAMAESSVAQAEAALAPLQVELAKMTLKAPRGGVVVERMLHEGELAAPGAPLLQIADLDNVELVVYIPENKIGRVKLGQEVEVTVDSYPGRVFGGEVVYISPRAEFTPKNVQTKEERVNTVFGVKVKVPNEDHALKAGMPADAVIVE